MAYEFEVLEKVKSRIASVKANWGFPAATPLIDRVIQATSQVRARIRALRPPAAGAAPAPGTATQVYYPEVYYQVPPEEEKPKVA